MALGRFVMPSHVFTRQTKAKPTHCASCDQWIRVGARRSVCEVCGLETHRQCALYVPEHCVSNLGHVASQTFLPFLGRPMPLGSGDPIEEDIGTLVHNTIDLIIFVNAKSGGQMGPHLLRKLRRAFGHDHVFDLSMGGPEPGLLLYKHSHDLRVLVCGGDGTVRWILSAIETMAFETEPKVAVLPVGTGNDFSRMV